MLGSPNELSDVTTLAQFRDWPNVCNGTWFCIRGEKFKGAGWSTFFRLTALFLVGPFHVGLAQYTVRKGMGTGWVWGRRGEKGIPIQKEGLDFSVCLIQRDGIKFTEKVTPRNRFGMEVAKWGIKTKY